MASVAYTAVNRGNLVGGHSAGGSYTLDFRAADIGRVRDANKSEQYSLDGTAVTTIYDDWKTYQVTTSIFTRASSSYNNFVEFLTSVLGGEEFDFDAYGTIASPDNVEACILVGNYQEQRVDASLYRFSFTIRVV